MRLEVFIVNKLIILLLLTLVSCQASESKDIISTKTRPTPSVSENVNSERFTAQISIPQQVETNQEFVISVELKNEAGGDVQITTGNPVFYYVVRDHADNAINTIARDDIGVVRPMPEGDVISEKLHYRFKQPGTYEISAMAEFSVQSGEESEVYKIETTRKSIRVSD